MGKHFDTIYAHNAEDDFREDKSLPVWLDEAFVELMKNLPV